MPPCSANLKSKPSEGPSIVMTELKLEGTTGTSSPHDFKFHLPIAFSPTHLHHDHQDMANRVLASRDGDHITAVTVGSTGFRSSGSLSDLTRASTLRSVSSNGKTARFASVEDSSLEEKLSFLAEERERGLDRCEAFAREVEESIEREVRRMKARHGVHRHSASDQWHFPATLASPQRASPSHAEGTSFRAPPQEHGGAPSNDSMLHRSRPRRVCTRATGTNPEAQQSRLEGEQAEEHHHRLHGHHYDGTVDDHRHCDGATISDGGGGGGSGDASGCGGGAPTTMPHALSTKAQDGDGGVISGNSDGVFATAGEGFPPSTECSNSKVTSESCQSPWAMDMLYYGSALPPPRRFSRRTAKWVSVSSNDLKPSQLQGRRGRSRACQSEGSHC